MENRHLPDWRASFRVLPLPWTRLSEMKQATCKIVVLHKMWLNVEMKSVQNSFLLKQKCRFVSAILYTIKNTELVENL